MSGGAKASPHSPWARSSAASTSSRPCASARANGPGMIPAPAIMPMSMSLMPAMPSSSTRQDSTSAFRPKRSTSVPVADSVAVLIEALSGLLPEVARLDQLLHLRRHVEAVAQRLVEVLGHVQDRVEPEQVGEEERAHRRSLRVGDELVYLVDSDVLLVADLPDLRDRRVEDAVDDEARRLGAADRLLADRLREVEGGLHGLLRRLVALDHLDQAHHRRRVEEVEAADLVGAARGVGHLADGKRARVRGEDRVAGRDGVELAEHRLLDLHPLRNRLHHEVHVAEALVLGGALDAAEDLLLLRVGLILRDLLLLDQAAKLGLGDLLGLLEALVDELLLHVLEHDVEACGGDDLGDLPAHGAGAHDGGVEYEHLTSERLAGAAQATATPLPSPRGRSGRRS